MVAVGTFIVFVMVTMGLSFYLGRNAKSAQGYFAAHGQIPWFINGVAFAGDYLSAASFLGICGMIAFYGYDGFLYSIGYLAGWIVALFVVAEPLKRLGKFTFADALDARFQSRGIKLAVGISTVAVSLFYLIPKMVGAGVLIQPLLGFPHWVGVVLVGTIVIYIVVSAGMVSTTYVQFLKGSLLVLFSAILTVLILIRGFQTEETAQHVFQRIGPFPKESLAAAMTSHAAFRDSEILPTPAGWGKAPYLLSRNSSTNEFTVWKIIPTGDAAAGQVELFEGQMKTKSRDGKTLVNGLVQGTKEGEADLYPVGHLKSLPSGMQAGSPVGPLEFFRTLQQSEVILWGKETLKDEQMGETTVFFQKITQGKDVLRPGTHPAFQGIHSEKLFDKLNFLSLMLALFCGTASLPHILIRYYTVKDEASARKSTIVGIGAIGFFYVLTLYLGLGAMTSGALDVTNDNMSAPLLAKSISEWLFAIISAIAFTTVLGTVSGLILASAGAVTHDLATHVLGIEMNDYEKVRLAKFASVVVGAIAIALGILFEKMNVSYLVGWAFSVAASANLPSLVMLLFWKGVTRQGVITAVVVGMTASLGWILLSADTFKGVYGLPAESAYTPFSQPGIVTIPLGFLTLIVVSLLTAKKENAS